MEAEAPELKEFEVKFKVNPMDHPLGMEYLTETIHAEDMKEAKRLASCLSDVVTIKEL